MILIMFIAQLSQEYKKNNTVAIKDYHKMSTIK